MLVAFVNDTDSDGAVKDAADDDDDGIVVGVLRVTLVGDNDGVATV
jgi:hypothetical protein